MEKDILGHKKELLERDETIRDKEKRIYDLKKKNQELEKFKFVLDYKIRELKRQAEPKDEQISDMRDTIKVSVLPVHVMVHERQMPQPCK